MNRLKDAEKRKDETIQETSIKFGRAEYDKEISSIFENIPVTKFLAPILSRKKVGMLTGQRGTGKTHLIMALEKEIPVKIYELDKEKLREGIVNFVPITNPEKPKITVVDDVHYLIKSMMVSRLLGGAVSEEVVVGKLEDFAKESKENGTKLILVADTGPAGLAMRFAKEPNIKRLLTILDGAFDSIDDKTYFCTYLGKAYDGSREKQNILNLDFRGSPVYYYDTPGVDTKEMTRRIARQFKMRDVPYAFYDARSGTERYQIDKEGYIDNVNSNVFDDAQINSNSGLRKTIATFRQLMVVSHVLGEISTNKLGLMVGWHNEDSEGRVTSVSFSNTEIEGIVKSNEELSENARKILINACRRGRKVSSFDFRKPVFWSVERDRNSNVDASVMELKNVGYIELKEQTLVDFAFDLTRKLRQRSASFSTELDLVRNAILNVYNKNTVGYGSKELVRQMLNAETDEGMLAVMINHDLSFEG